MPELSPLPCMIEQLWWVIPGYLAGAAKPTIEDVAEFPSHGIGAIVSLLSDDSNLTLYEQHQIDYLWLPIEGGMAPSLEQLNRLCEFVAIQRAAASQAIAIHCSSGRRRTGTMLVALLMQQGIGYREALERVLAANPEIELRETQTNFLQWLARQQSANHPIA